MSLRHTPHAFVTRLSLLWVLSGAGSRAPWPCLLHPAFLSPIRFRSRWGGFASPGGLLSLLLWLLSLVLSSPANAPLRWGGAGPITGHLSLCLSPLSARASLATLTSADTSRGYVPRHVRLTRTLPLRQERAYRSLPNVAGPYTRRQHASGPGRARVFSRLVAPRSACSLPALLSRRRDLPTRAATPTRSSSSTGAENSCIHATQTPLDAQSPAARTSPRCPRRRPTLETRRRAQRRHICISCKSDVSAYPILQV